MSVAMMNSCSEEKTRKLKDAPAIYEFETTANSDLITKADCGGANTSQICQWWQWATNLEVYATITIFVKDAEQLFHKLVSGAALQSFGHIFIKDDISHLWTDFGNNFAKVCHLALGHSGCKHLFHLLL